MNNLKRIAASEHISHAYIFEGENAALLREAAEAFAGEMKVSAADVLFPEHEKPNLISVDDVRTGINSSVHIKPYNSPHKVYIVRDAERMNVQAQNALLKTLEEPPAYVVIILLTPNAGIFLPTILSRCVKLSMGEEVEESNRKEETDAAEAAELVREIMRSLPTMDTKTMLDHAARLEGMKLLAGDVLEEIRHWYRDVLAYRMSGNLKIADHREDVTAVRQIAGRTSYEGIERVLEMIDRTARRLDANVNFELSAELLLMTMRDTLSDPGRQRGNGPERSAR